ncbi:MAG: RNA polymerase-associated protein RapA [Thermoanaerobaculia bacterium]|nr:RNA polymerase-associated protein RapA [Thermoanaerobaculia bacterium]
MNFTIGSLVNARHREWVVLPGSTDEALLVRPLGGTEAETTALLPALESVVSTQFSPPDPTRPGDDRSCRLLRDAVRLGFRSSAGPFRSFARINVEPRPYQLVPLLMALRLDPVRILIADDVGIGKTIEAGLIARELLDRGEVERMAVLCPPHLAEQWQRELHEKFHVEADLVLPSTVARLERPCNIGESLFEYPGRRFFIVSTDFIKSDRRREEFQRACPELVIIDEAHTCVSSTQGAHQRYKLVRGLVERSDTRHIILVTATPHSGKEEAFRDLLTLLNPEFQDLPADLTGPQNEPNRRRVAAHLVQRRRGDILQYLDARTDFPRRDVLKDVTYKLSPEYKRLFDRVLSYAREVVHDPAQGTRHRQRIRWWSMLALLRSLASSPRAAAQTLHTRSGTADTETEEQANEVGKQSLFDLSESEAADGFDNAPGADAGEESAEEGKVRKRLEEMSRDAAKLEGANDQKLQTAIAFIKKELLGAGFNPIIFCRFIPTAEYVAEALRKALPADIEVQAVTGALPPEERELRVLELGKAKRRVLVATDCLSEGINLQEYFDAVFHYDLSWNPTRHEQREGRVDRYGQKGVRDETGQGAIRTATYYGIDNYIDAIVVRVLLKRHKTIQGTLGVSVPVPFNPDEVIEAVFEGLLLHEKQGELFEDFFQPKQRELDFKWKEAEDRETRSRTMFAQLSIKVEDVARELTEIRAAIGAGADVRSFMREALSAYGSAVSQKNGLLNADLMGTPRALQEALALEKMDLHARFEKPVDDDEVYLTRTHPIVEGLSAFVFSHALDEASIEGKPAARRSGVIYTDQVQRKTTLLLVRYRFQISSRKPDGSPSSTLAEDIGLLAFEGSPSSPVWIPSERAVDILHAKPGKNIGADRATYFLERVIPDLPHLAPHFEERARQLAEQLHASHTRVRPRTTRRYRVEPYLPVDVLGVYLYFPVQP